MAESLPARLTPREGQKFGVTVGLAFGLFAAISYWRGHDTAPAVMAALGGALLLAGLAIPGRLGPVYRAWMRLALLLSKVSTPIFMGLIYFVALTPTSIVMRLLGHKPLDRKRVNDSYWVTRDPAREPGSMSRQF
jgi:hypothetical protein